MFPVVGGRKKSIYPEMLSEILAKIIERLNIVVRPVYMPVPMAEVNVRHDKYAAVSQEPRYFGKYLRLEASCILKDALSDYNVEALITESNGRFNEVRLDQIRRRIMYGDVNTVILDIGTKKGHQGRWAATNIEKSARFTLCDCIYNPCGFLEPIVRLAVF